MARRVARRALVMGLALALAQACGGVRRESPPPEPTTTAAIEAPAPVEAPPPTPDATPAPTAEPAPTTLAPPPAPGVTGAPVAGLSAWSAGLGASSDRDVVAVDGALVVIDEAHFTRVSGDGTTPTLVQDNPIGRGAAFADELLSPAPMADGVLLVRGRDGALAALEPTTLALRWTIHRMDLPRSGSEEAHLSSGDAFFVVAHDHLLVLDPHDGHVLWQAAYEGSFFSRGQRWRAAPGLFVLLEGAGLTARDARTGATRWHVEGFDARSDRLFDPDGDRVPILHDDTVVIVSLTDGSELARVALGAAPPWGRTVALRGEELYALVPTHADAIAETQLRRYDLAHARASTWRSAALATDATGFHPSIAVDDDAVFVCTTTWFGWALDRAGGHEAWSGPIDECGAPTLWRPRPGAPNVLLLAGWSADGLARGADAPAPRAAVVSGTVRCGGAPAAHVRVWVDGARVEADAAGHYRASTHARAAVVVHVEQFERSEEDFCIADDRTFPVAAAIDASFELPRGDTSGLL